QPSRRSLRSRGEGAHRVCRTRMSSKCTALHGARCIASGTRNSPGRVRNPIHLSNSTRFFVPAARFCARVLLFGFAHPDEGVAERRETYGCLRGIRWACAIGAGQAPSEAPCVPIRGTPASRRSHRGDFGLRAALPLTGISAGSVTANSHIRVIVPGGGPLPPGAAVTSHGRGTPRLAPPSGCLRTTPLR